MQSKNISKLSFVRMDPVNVPANWHTVWPSKTTIIT